MKQQLEKDAILGQTHDVQAEFNPGRKTILLVEDEAFVLEAAGEILEGAGYKVLKARTAADAVREFGLPDSRVDLVLTDVVLPDRNGKDLVNDLSREHVPPPVIFMSGYPESYAISAGIVKDGAAFLAKPFCVASLVGLVRQMLDGQAKGGRSEQASYSQ